MPSDPPETYLRNILVSGTAPFRFRSGIRTLLGFPENPDPRIAYSSTLPLPGIHYLRQPAFSEVEIETSRMFSATGVPESESVEPPNPAQFKKAKEPEAKIENRHAAAIRSVEQSVFRSDTSKPSGRPSGDTREPVRNDRPVTSQRDQASAEQLQIDIPGFSEKQLRFPALAAQKVEETRSSQDPAAPGASIRQTAPSINISDPGGKAGPTPERETSRTPVVFRHDDPVPAHPVSEPRLAKQHLSSGKADVETAFPYRNPSSSISAKPEPKRQPSPVQPAQRVAEVQIEQLRQSLSGLRRKTASKVEETKSTPQAEPAEMNRPANPAAQPVVIVNRSQPQRLSPPAFWERSHLSQFLRLRRLR